MFGQNQPKQPTIRERLDYLEVCNTSIEYFSKKVSSFMQDAQYYSKSIEERRQNEAMAEKYRKQAQSFKNLKHMIIEDLAKDPVFLNYANSLVSEPNSIQESNQQISEEEKTSSRHM